MNKSKQSKHVKIVEKSLLIFLGKLEHALSENNKFCWQLPSEIQQHSLEQS